MSRDVFLPTADGLSLHVRDHAPVGRERGAPVLCLHGLTRNLADFDELASRITTLGRRVVAASQRGRGLSDRDPKPERYAPPTYVADMLGLLDQLGIERAVWIGTSMGGLMTMIAANAAPTRLAAAVLNDVGPELDPAGLARIRGYVGGAGSAADWREAAAICRRINGPAFPAEDDEAFWEGFARKLFRGDATGRLVFDYDPAIARSIAPEGPAPPDASLWPLFDAFGPIPTLVIRGAISDILAPATVEVMRSRKPDLAAAEVPRVGHAPFMTEPEAWSALRRFLEADSP